MAGANHAFGISSKTDEIIEEMKTKSVFKRVAEIYPDIAERFLGAENEGDLEPADLSDEDVELFIDPKFSPLLYSGMLIFENKTATIKWSFLYLNID